ncbi:MAG TPA: LPXTG cell wall anchor domain-containing protein, partial [Beutenbergiaceae bacterium]|nr:LPXTG cell wall anchor domain-containing protein [Beutenbergiaceae bacterium]
SATPVLAPGKACWLNDGEDLVVWTTHFTTFIAYSSPATTEPPSDPGVSEPVGDDDAEALPDTGVDSSALAGLSAALVALGVAGLLVRASVRRRATDARH